MTNKEVKEALAEALRKANETAEANCKAYIAWNPEEAKNRQYLMQIEKAGINNLYYTMLKVLSQYK